VGSPTVALLWGIWRQHRWTVAAIAGLTLAGRVVDDPLSTLLAMAAFLLLFSVFNYTESSSARGVGQFPRRLFTLPVTSLRLVSVPMLAGIASIELLYLVWMEPLSRGGSASAPFVAVLLAALVVFYLWIFWTLERAGTLRLLVFGMTAFAVFFVGMLPSFPPTPPPPWRSEIALGGVVAMLAVLAFLHSRRHVALIRGGGAAHRAASLLGRPIDIVAPVRRKAFTSAEAAHFWLEWRSSGMVLPTLVGGVVLLGILPVSWLVRSDAAYTINLLLVALASPIVLAVPVGIAFCKPVFWTEDLAVPSFVAVRPFSSEDLVAIKVKVAALSAAISWVVLLVLLAVWLSTWATLDAVSQLAISLWAFHGRSVAAVYGIAGLVALAGMCLTWRLLVSRLWSGLSGKRPLFVGSVVAMFALVIASIVTDAYRLPGWVLADPARLEPIAWIGALLVIAKYWVAAYAWRSVERRYLRAYLPLWLGATASFLAVGLVLWGMVRIYMPLDADRSRSLVIILALLATPLTRVALARSALARNRHRLS
jgi:hypothetical protein